MSIEVSIVGASGYTGGELLRILAGHPKAEVVGTYGRTTAGMKLSDLHPNLLGVINGLVKEPDYEVIGRESDVVFTATPHGVSMEFVPEILDGGAKVIDLSADYRLDDVQVYERYYKKHESPDLVSVYGLPEVYRDDIKDANLVANPGCYPTAALLSLIPLLTEGIIELDNIIIDSKSGTSGAGAKPNKLLHHPTCTDNVRAYKVTTHRHTPEVRQEVRKIAGETPGLYFTPHLVPLIRGILNTSHVFVKSSESQEDLLEIYRDFYEKESFVRVIEDLPQTSSVRGSNFCDVGIRKSENSRRAVIVSAIDNLVKGASGQAIQNMNIMFGFDEEDGLGQIALRP